MTLGFSTLRPVAGYHRLFQMASFRIQFQTLSFPKRVMPIFLPSLPTVSLLLAVKIITMSGWMTYMSMICLERLGFNAVTIHVDVGHTAVWPFLPIYVFAYLK